VFVTAMLHGNEPAGALAFRRVFEHIERHDLPVRGELVGVAGNLAARARGRRFLRHDLNRVWTERRVEALRRRHPALDEAEDAEQRAVLEELEAAVGRARGPVLLVDLHTTSGESPPFALMSDVLRNRRFAFALPVPVILGLEETVDGTLLEFVTERGHSAIVVETGRHDDPRCIERHEAVLWLLLARAGLVDAADAPDLDGWRRRLEGGSDGLPRVVEVVQHHKIAPGEEFEMVHDGFVGFQRVRQGQVLARDQLRTIEARVDGRLLMPRYQPEGEDGLFIVRRVRRGWLWLSRWARKLGFLPRLLPGVSHHPTRPRTLVVRPPARWLVVELFHLFGYRKRRHEGDVWTFAKRNE
jgi:succinylglutamate desuccinylase